MSVSIQTVSGQSRLQLGDATARQNLVTIGTSWNVARLGILFGLDADNYTSYEVLSNTILSSTNYVTLFFGFCRSNESFPYANGGAAAINAVGIGTLSQTGSFDGTKFAFDANGSGALTNFRWVGAAAPTVGGTYVGGALHIPVDGRKTAMVLEYNQTTCVLRVAYPAANIHSTFDLTEGQLDRAVRTSTFDGVVEYLDDVFEAAGGAVTTRCLTNSTTLASGPTNLDAACVYFSRELRQKLQLRRIRAVKIS